MLFIPLQSLRILFPPLDINGIEELLKHLSTFLPINIHYLYKTHCDLRHRPEDLSEIAP